MAQAEEIRFTDKRGISAVQLANTLGICYDSAWHLLDQIRAAMGQRDAQYLLNGIVEMDDGYVGGPCHGGKRGRGTEKAQVVAALSKTEQGIPRMEDTVRLHVCQKKQIGLGGFISEWPRSVV